MAGDRAQKETPVPIRRERQRKGVRGQHRQGAASLSARQTLSGYALRSQLTWTHWRLVMRVEDPAARERRHILQLPTTPPDGKERGLGYGG